MRLLPKVTEFHPTQEHPSALDGKMLATMPKASTGERVGNENGSLQPLKQRNVRQPERFQRCLLASAVFCTSVDVLLLLLLLQLKNEPWHW